MTLPLDQREASYAADFLARRRAHDRETDLRNAARLKHKIDRLEGQLAEGELVRQRLTADLAQLQRLHQDLAALIDAAAPAT